MELLKIGSKRILERIKSEPCVCTRREQPGIIDGKICCYCDGKLNYAHIYWHNQQHHKRYLRFVESMPRKLVCQECRGWGGETEVVLDDGSGPWLECGFCEGTGLVTPWMRGFWLRWKAEEKREKNKCLK